MLCNSIINRPGIPEDGEPMLLKPGVELCDVRIGATQPLLLFSIPLVEEALVTINFQEFNTASRCMLLMSPTCSRPSCDSAVWRLASPETNKTVTIHPADDNYRLGQLYLCIRYLEDSGSTFVRLNVELQPTFYSMWYCRALRPAPETDREAVSIMTMRRSGQGARGASMVRTSGATSSVTHSKRSDTPAATAMISSVSTLSTSATTTLSEGPEGGKQSPISCSLLYIGSWKGSRHHGRGVAYYAVTECTQSLLEVGQASRLLLLTVYERHNLPWSALSLPEDTQLNGTPLDDAFIARITGVADMHNVSGWRIMPAVELGVEAYYGDWQNGSKDGLGIYQWADRAYVGEWRKGVREGFGSLECEDGHWYRGEWANDLRHGEGEALILPEGNIYKGQWCKGLREGKGCLTFSSGVAIYGTWVADELQPTVRAVYPDGTIYDGNWSVDCRHGDGVYTDSAGCIHTATWFRDNRHGKGHVKLPNNVLYEGTYDKGVEVDGVFHFPNGDEYRGEWDSTNNVREGFGKCDSRNGDVYEGHWVADMRDGEGTMTYGATGAVYAGAWREDRRHGFGTLTDADGTYEGNFEDDVRSGEGTQLSPDGSHYKGAWRSNHRAGSGVFYVASEGIIYQGIFLHDRLVGRGTSVRQEDQDKYEGSWLDGMEQGHGTRTLPTGDIIRGVWHRGVHQNGHIEYDSAEGGHYVGAWHDGQRHGVGTQVNVDGTVYEGQWLHNKPHGHGRLTHPDGETLECEWEDGNMLDGDASLEFLDGSVYVGTVQSGIPHGVGKLTYPDGTIFDGRFEEGVYCL